MTVDEQGDRDGFVRYRLAQEADDSLVDVEASGRRVVQFRSTRVARSPDVDRTFRQRIAGGSGDFTVSGSADELDLGALSATRHSRLDGAHVVLQDDPGDGDQLASVLEGVQARLDAGVPFEEALRQTPGGTLRRDPVSGAWSERVGDDWWSFQLAVPDDQLGQADGFRLGVPRGDHVEYLHAVRAQAPAPASEWLALEGDLTRAAVLVEATPPVPGGRVIAVRTPDGVRGELVHDGLGWRTRSTDPVFGLPARSSGAHVWLRLPLLDDLRARQVLPGEHVATWVDDEVAVLVNGDEVVLVDAVHAWHAEVRRTVHANQGEPVRVRVQGDRLLWVDGPGGPVVSDTVVPVGELERELRDGALPYLEESLGGELPLLEEGSLVPDGLPAEVRAVRVRLDRSTGPVTPDLRAHEGRTYVRVGTAVAVTEVVLLSRVCGDEPGEEDCRQEPQPAPATSR